MHMKNSYGNLNEHSLFVELYTFRTLHFTLLRYRPSERNCGNDPIRYTKKTPVIEYREKHPISTKLPEILELHKQEHNFVTKVKEIETCRCRIPNIAVSCNNKGVSESHPFVFSDVVQHLMIYFTK